MENGRGRKRLGSVARFSLAGCTPPPPVERGIGEKKERNVNAFSLLYSFSHFSSSPLSPFCCEALLSRYTLVVLCSFLLSVRFLIPALSYPFIFITLTSLTSVPFLSLSTFLSRASCFSASWSFTSYPRSHSFFISYSCLWLHSCGPIPVLSSYFNFFYFNSYLSLL